MTIKVKLSPAGIRQAEKELNAYKRELDNRLTVFVKRLSEQGADVARVRFAAAAYDGTNDVKVEVEQDGHSAKVIASGKAVMFIEFGAGTSYPEHPSGMYKHGEYGKGQGSNPKGWAYEGEPGTNGHFLREGVYRTKGNPPAMAMWSAVEDIAAAVTNTWREVMQGD